MNTEVCNEEFLVQFFKTYRAPNCFISRMDQSLCKFDNLLILNLSNNAICRVENVPPQLRELSLTNNMIDEVEGLRAPHQSLIHLGLSYNRIRNVTLAVIAKNFPSLFCLDVSFNELSDFKSSLNWFEELTKLKMLYVQGNPLALSDQSREILKQRMPELRILDGSGAFTEQEVNDRKKFLKKMARL